MAGRLRAGGVDGPDVVEIRVDALAGNLAAVRKCVAEIKLPVLLTVRHPAEGGAGNLSAAERRKLFMEFLPHASLVDVELRSAVAMCDAIAEAKKGKIAVVISDHHFNGTPSLAQMKEKRRGALAAGADIFKLAAKADDASALLSLMQFLASGGDGRLSVMGMGKLGKVSRLALACSGSVLNYGYLDQANAPGQWEAHELKRLLISMGC